VSEPLELAEIAAAHPVRHVSIDFERLNVAELLSVGDVVDMAAALGVAPEKLLTVLNRSGTKPLEVIVVIAWIIGRKAEPELELETVRRTWRIAVPGGPVVDPTPPPERKRRRSSGRATSSASRG
jgi:hypothetical protein